MASHKPASAYTNKESLEAIKEVLIRLRDIDWTLGTDRIEKLLLEEDGYDTIPEHKEDEGLIQNLQKENRYLKTQLEEKRVICQNLEKVLNDYESEDNESTYKKGQTLKEENQQLKANVKYYETEVQRYRSDREKQTKPHEEVMSKQMHSIERLTNENEEFKVTIKSNEQVTYDLLKQVESLNKQIKKFKHERNANDTKLKNIEEEKQTLPVELKDTKTRLSKIMSVQMTHNNPDIADLSDQNRPDKLAEKYQELYDNQWSDAYEALEKIRPYYSDEEKVYFLQGILKEARQYCEREASAQSELLKKALFTERTDKPLPDIIKKQLKELKKAVIPINREVIYQRFLYNLQAEHSRKIGSSEMKQFIEECVHVCWIMVMSDPPITFGPELFKGDSIDYNYYRTYTTKGHRVNYEVWPPLLVNQDGALLTKGVVECIDEVYISSNSDEVSTKANVKKNTSIARPKTAPTGKGINLYFQDGRPYVLPGQTASTNYSNGSGTYDVGSPNEISRHGASSVRNYRQTTAQTDFSKTTRYSGYTDYRL